MTDLYRNFFFSLTRYNDSYNINRNMSNVIIINDGIAQMDYHTESAVQTLRME